MKTQHQWLVTLIAGLTLILASCVVPIPVPQAPPADQPEVEEAEASINEIAFTASEYVFAGPERIPAGWTRIRLENEGEEIHHAQLIKLPDDRSLDDFFAAMEADPEHPPHWLSFSGGPSVVLPGDGTAVTMELEAGEYVVLCVIPDENGIPHAAHGMVRPLTVTEREAAAATAPEADITMTLFDFNFALSDQITPGTHTFHVVNDGPQPHEVAVVQLAPDTTPEEFLASVEPGAGPPLGRPIGGLQVIDAGAEGYFTAEFQAGNDYMLLCFHPDEETGAPHIALGMMQVLSVTE